MQKKITNGILNYCHTNQTLIPGRLSISKKRFSIHINIDMRVEDVHTIHTN